MLENSPTATKLSNPKNTAKQESFVEPVNLRQLVIGLNEPNHEMKIPYVTVNENWETMDGSKTETVLLVSVFFQRIVLKAILKANRHVESSG